MKNKIVIIMRGLPGSGKSTKALTYNGVIVSADHFFIEQDGGYSFNISRLAEAHSECMRKFLWECENETPIIVVDNTNTKKWEYSDYVQKAKYFGYSVIIDSLFDGKCTTNQLAKRNIHGCPEAKIIAMMNRWED